MKFLIIILLFFKLGFASMFSDILTDEQRALINGEQNLTLNLEQNSKKYAQKTIINLNDFNILKARNRGYSDNQIYDFLKQNYGNKFDFDEAKNAGVSKATIVNFLLQRQLDNLAISQGFNLGALIDDDGKIYFGKRSENGEIIEKEVTDYFTETQRQTQDEYKKPNIFINSLWRMLDWIVIMTFALLFYYSGRNLINKIKNYKNNNFTQNLSNTKEQKIKRLFRVLYFISLLLSATIIGSLIGIPLFLILLITQYIIYGNFNPHFMFESENKQYEKSEIFLLLCYFVLFCFPFFGILLLKFRILNIYNKDDIFIFFGFCFGYFLYIVFTQYVLIGNFKFWKLFKK